MVVICQSASCSGDVGARVSRFAVSKSSSM